MDHNPQDTLLADGADAWPDGEGVLRVAMPGDGHAPADTDGEGEALIIDVDGFEGPLDLLLSLARHQKVDLAKISVLGLVEQYLDFINRATRMRLEIAADYLVMAAWLAYLKSRLLLPDPEPEEEPPAEELAARLAFRLQRLQAMREASAALFARAQVGQDVFLRGASEETGGERRIVQVDSLFELLRAYSARRQRSVVQSNYTVRRMQVMPLKEARDVLEGMVGGLGEWSSLDSLLIRYLTRPGQERSVMASSLSATLEMARDGLIDIKQDGHFAPIYMRVSTKRERMKGRDSAGTSRS